MKCLYLDFQLFFTVQAKIYTATNLHSIPSPCLRNKYIYIFVESVLFRKQHLDKCIRLSDNEMRVLNLITCRAF